MNPALTSALASSLLHFVWQGAALAPIVALTLFVTRDARVRYAVACITLFAMPIAFAVTLSLVYPRPASPATQTHISRSLFFALGSATLQLPSESAFSAAQHMMTAFVPFWFAGIALLYLRSALSWVAVRKMRHSAIAPVAPEWRERLAATAHRLQIKRATELFESRSVDVPVVAGFLRPVILIPAGCLANIPAEQMEYLLIHELAHVRRLDYLVNLFQRAIEGLLFYHPAVWWISNIIRREREHCCDDVVLSVHPEPREYARTLADLEQTRWASVPAANGGDLNTRIRRVLGFAPAQHAAPAAVISLILASAAVFLTMATIPRSLHAQAPPSDDRLTRWVKEDVAYIISDQEREAYNNLQTNAEKEHFVEQFWLRRDPTPGTPENEFKQEHYRRIAYANERFASSLPGWKTDRGRIYVTFGPPDEIDSHPSCGPNEPPHEDWQYKWIEGVGNNVIIDFRDPTCKGEYFMTRDPNFAHP